MSTIFLSQRSTSGLFDFMTLCLCFKNRMHDSKTLECLNSSQKVRILLKKFGEIRKSLSCRERNSSKGPTNLFDLSKCLSFRVLELQRFFCLKRVSRFKGPTNLLDLPKYFGFLVFELQRFFLPEKGQQIQCTGKFVRPSEMFEFPSIRVIESQLYRQK